jgi:hypothetical protein
VPAELEHPRDVDGTAADFAVAAIPWLVAAAALVHRECFLHHQKPPHAPAATRAMMTKTVNPKSLAASMGHLLGVLAAKGRSQGAPCPKGRRNGHDDPDD